MCRFKVLYLLTPNRGWPPCAHRFTLCEHKAKVNMVRCDCFDRVEIVWLLGTRKLNGGLASFATSTLKLGFGHAHHHNHLQRQHQLRRQFGRSEERRVGEECRS